MKTNYTNYDSEYSFKVEKFNFDGPLDLLLSLVKDKKISINEINLVEIADRYLEIISQLKEQDIDLAADYLVMAATLLKIKAAMAIQEPGQEIPEEIEEDKRQILRQLAEYEQFKSIKEALKTYELDRQDIFIKVPSNVDEFIVDTNDTRLDGHSNPVKLIAVLRKMFERVYAQKLRTAKLETFKLSPSDQYGMIKELLRKHEKLTFQMVFSQPSMGHFVVTLLAVLVLAKEQYLKIIQEKEFEEISIIRGELYDEK